MKIKNLFLLYSPLMKGVTTKFPLNKGGLRGLFLSTLCCLLLTVFLWGCGAGGGSAPPGSTITIQPSSSTVTEYAGTDFVPQDFTINLKDSEGTPIYDGKITISYIWATQNYANCVRFVDLNNPSFSPFDAYTDRFGNYYLRVYFAGTTSDGTTCSHKGDLEVRSGDAYTTATISVNQ